MNKTARIVNSRGAEISKEMAKLRSHLISLGTEPRAFWVTPRDYVHLGKWMRSTRTLFPTPRRIRDIRMFGVPVEVHKSIDRVCAEHADRSVSASVGSSPL